MSGAGIADLTAAEEQLATGPPPAPTSGGRLWLRIWAARATAVATLGIVWQIVAARRLVDPIFIGKPSGILASFWKGLVVEGTFATDLAWTMTATLLAFVLGSLAGIVVGLLFIVYPTFEKFFEPLLAALNALPRIALAPLFLLWFGLGISSKIALGLSLTFFIVLSSTVAGARSVDLDLLTLARTLGATSTQTFLRITLPGAVPTMFSGLRLGLIYALLGVIAGEIIAAQHGLGQTLTYLAGTFQTDGVFAVLLLLAMLGSGLTWVMSQLEVWLLRWR